MFDPMTVAPLLASAPNWADKVTAVGSVLAGLGFLGTAAGVFVAARQLGATRRQVDESRRDRQAGVIAEWGRRWDDDRMSQARSRALRYDNVELAELVARRNQRGWSVTPSLARTVRRRELQVLLRVPNYFEDLGLMVEYGGLEVDLVAKMIGALALHEWRRWELAVAEMQKASPSSYSRFQRLAELLGEQELD
jgi:hypothetical protein